MQHKVTITKPFYIGVFEITQKQYELVTGAVPGNIADFNKGDNFPVCSLQWNAIRGNSDTYNWPSVTDVDPASFMGIVREKTGMATFDLPTEAMWEYACRAGTATAFNNGKNPSKNKPRNGKDPNLVGIACYSTGYGRHADSRVCNLRRSRTSQHCGGKIWYNIRLTFRERAIIHGN